MYNFSEKRLAHAGTLPHKLELDLEAFWDYVDMMYFSPVCPARIFEAKVQELTTPSIISSPPPPVNGIAPSHLIGDHRKGSARIAKTRLATAADEEQKGKRKRKAEGHKGKEVAGEVKKRLEKVRRKNAELEQK